MELVFSVTQEEDGGFVAECLSHDIFTQGDTWEQLRANIREAVSGYFFDQPKPAAVRLHLVRDEPGPDPLPALRLPPGASGGKPHHS